MLEEYEQVRKNLITVASLKAIALVLAFLVNYVLVRYLGVAEFGRYAEFYATVIIASIIGRLGLELVAVRELSKARGVFSDRSIVKVILFYVCLTTFFVATVIFSVTMFLEKFTPTEALLGIFTSTAFSIKVINSEFLRGRNRPAISTIINGAVTPALIIVVVLYTGFVTSPKIAFVVLLLATVFAAIFSMHGTYNLAIRPIDRAGEKATFSLLWPSIKNLWPVSVLSMASHRWVPVLILGYSSSPTDITIYAVGFQIATLVSFLLMATNIFAAPVYSSLADPDHREEFQTYIWKIYRVNAITALAVSVFLTVMADMIMTTYSQDLTGGTPVLILLVLGQLVNVLGGHFGTLLTMTHQDKVRRFNSYFGFGSFIVVALLLTPALGAMGASLAFLLSNVLLAVHGNIKLIRNTKVSATFPF